MTNTRYIMAPILFLLALGCFRSTNDTGSLTPVPSPIESPTTTQNTVCVSTEINDGMGGKSTYVIKITGGSSVAKAQNILNGSETSATHFMGTVVTDSTPQRFNPNWHFHLVETTIDFFEIATEVCDATVITIENNLSAWDGKTWCPWTSSLKALVDCL